MIEVKTKFDGEAAKELNKLQMRRMVWFFVLFSLLFIAIGLVNVLVPIDDFDRGYGVVMLIFGVAFTPLVYLFSMMMQGVQIRSMKLLGDKTSNYFRFDENGIYQEMERGEDYNATSNSSYKLLFKAFENEKYFFMYISNMQAHIIPKADIITGSSEELTMLFAEKLGEKFVRYVKKKNVKNKDSKRENKAE